jgi:hypothetical protein
MYPIYVIDTSVIGYHILHTIKDGITLNCSANVKIADQYTRLALAWVNNLGFLPSSHRPSKAAVVWVGDSKPYWRSRFQADYKHGRSMPDPYLSAITGLAYAEMDVLRFAGYEADDIAALIYMMWSSKRDRFTTLNFATVDSDWMGFCSDCVLWMDTKGYLPRVRDTEAVYAWMRNKVVKGTKAIQRYKFHDNFEASDIWRFKTETGDKSDNLAAGCASFLIDLLHPHSDYCLWTKTEAISAAKPKLLNPRVLVNPADLQHKMSRLGLPVPIPHISATEPAFSRVANICYREQAA